MIRRLVGRQFVFGWSALARALRQAKKAQAILRGSPTNWLLWAAVASATPASFCSLRSGSRARGAHSNDWRWATDRATVRLLRAIATGLGIIGLVELWW